MTDKTKLLDSGDTQQSDKSIKTVESNESLSVDTLINESKPKAPSSTSDLLIDK
jgi:hypothetical protein